MAALHAVFVKENKMDLPHKNREMRILASHLTYD
jgi:hypothetical protein